MRYAEVVPDTRSVIPQATYTYEIPEELHDVVIPGMRVAIPFGKKETYGYVVACTEVVPYANAKKISSVPDGAPLLRPHQIELGRFIADQYCAPLGAVLKAMLPTGIRSKSPTAQKRASKVNSRILEAAQGDGNVEVPPTLTEPQRVAAEPLLQAIADHVHVRVLLHGVTGSGKTEVYLTAIESALAVERQAIVLVPEIALTPQMIHRFAARFPGRVTVLHSALTDKERAAEWYRISLGKVDVVVGSRSAIFAPVPHLGIIVVDEEDALAYKQDRLPRYHAVDVAFELGRLCNVPVVVGSATPRVETFWKAHTGQLQLTSLPERVTRRSLPPIEVVDLREELKAGNRSPLSPVLVRALAHCHKEGGQSILFLNRRGMATVVVCRNCGDVVSCSHCSISLVYHRGQGRCVCHYCGHTEPLPVICATCGSTKIRGLGMGTERLEQEVTQLFPSMRLLRMDRDTTTTRESYFDIYEAFRRGDADCLIGTQMVAKGWDLSNVRLVGIVNADTALHFPDYRSGEITFSLITQVAGRAGRGDEAAQVILQTYSPDHYAVRHASTHDYMGFAHDEIRIRKQLGFPPYSRLIACTFSHKDDEKCRIEAEKTVSQLSDRLKDLSGVEILGPTPAFLHRLRGLYRWQFMVKGTEVERVFPALPRGQGWSIDVDPAP